MLCNAVVAGIERHDGETMELLIAHAGPWYMQWHHLLAFTAAFAVGGSFWWMWIKDKLK